MKELTLDPAQLCPERRHPGPYRYAILTDEVAADGFYCESYGIRISAASGESVCIPHITVSMSRINELAQLLIRNQVGPDHLRDVVDDWL